MVFPTWGVDGSLCSASVRLESHRRDLGSLLSGTAVVTGSETGSAVNGFSLPLVIRLLNKGPASGPGWWEGGPARTQ